MAEDQAAEIAEKLFVVCREWVRNPPPKPASDGKDKPGPQAGGS